MSSNQYCGKTMHERKERRIKAVIQCLKEGMRSTKQIAEELGVSQVTIRRDLRYIRGVKER